MSFYIPPNNATVNEDTNDVREENLTIPWPINPSISYLYYDCTVTTVLDSGIVIHNRLPQQNRYIDSLSSVDFDNSALNELVTDGVNIKAQDQYKDIVQKMGHSRFWFRLSGQAIRAGYKIPIPAIKSIGGVAAIPYDRNPQWAYNKIVPGANFGGIILWYAQWSLWYSTLVPPINNYIPTSDPSVRVRGDDPIPTKGIQAPFTIADDAAKPNVSNIPGITDASRNITGGIR